MYVWGRSLTVMFMAMHGSETHMANFGKARTLIRQTLASCYMWELVHEYSDRLPKMVK